MKRFAYTFIQGSTRPPLTIPITDFDDAPINLGNAVSASLVASLLPGTDEADLAINWPLDIVGLPADGRLRATWTSAFTKTLTPGNYVGQVEVLKNDGNTDIWGEIDITVVAARKKQT